MSATIEPVSVRAAQVSDLDELMFLSRTLALSVQDPDPGGDRGPLMAAAFSTDPWCECLVAVHGGAIVGFASFCRRFEAHTGLRSVWIGDLAVTADHRGQGVGTALLSAVRSRAVELGAVAISFEVWVQNDAALGFYLDRGAVVVDDRHILQLPLSSVGIG